MERFWAGFSTCLVHLRVQWTVEKRKPCDWTRGIRPSRIFRPTRSTPSQPVPLNQITLFSTGCYGATDELVYNAVENVVHVRALHATLLRLLRLDHERLTVKYQGLDMKLTGVEPARVIQDILA